MNTPLFGERSCQLSSSIEEGTGAVDQRRQKSFNHRELEILMGLLNVIFLFKTEEGRRLRKILEVLAKVLLTSLEGRGVEEEV